MNTLLKLDQNKTTIPAGALEPWASEANRLSSVITFADLPEAFRKMCASHGVTEYTVTLRDQLIELSASKAVERMSYGNILSKTWASGAKYEVFDCKVSDFLGTSFFVTSQEGESMIKNPETAFPLVKDVQKRNGMDNLVSFLSSFYVPEGKLIGFALTSDVQVGITRHSTLPYKFSAALSWCNEVMSPLLANMKDTSVAALTGERWCQWVASTLSSISMDDYLALHQIVAEKILGVPLDGANSMAECVTKMGKTKVVKTELEKACNTFIEAMSKKGIKRTSAFVWDGVLPAKFRPDFRPKLKQDVVIGGTENIALQANAMTMNILGGKTGGMNAVSAGMDIFNMSSRNERELILLISAAVATFLKMKKVCIIASNVGDAEIVLNSIAKAAGRELTDKDVRWVVPASELKKVKVDRKFVSISVPRGYPTILFRPRDVITTCSSYSQTKLFATESFANLLSPIPKSNSIIYYGPIYGGMDGARGQKWIISKYGNNTNFLGWLSTEPLELAIYSTKGGYEFICPKTANGMEEWCKMVVHGVRFRIQQSMGAALYYSPICNVVKSLNVNSVNHFAGMDGFAVERYAPRPASQLLPPHSANDEERNDEEGSGGEIVTDDNYVVYTLRVDDGEINFQIDKETAVIAASDREVVGTYEWNTFSPSFVRVWMKNEDVLMAYFTGFADWIDHIAIHRQVEKFNFHVELSDSRYFLVEDFNSKDETRQDRWVQNENDFDKARWALVSRITGEKISFASAKQAAIDYDKAKGGSEEKPVELLTTTAVTTSTTTTTTTTSNVLTTETIPVLVASEAPKVLGNVTPTQEHAEEKVKPRKAREKSNVWKEKEQKSSDAESSEGDDGGKKIANALFSDELML